MFPSPTRLAQDNDCHQHLPPLYSFYTSKSAAYANDDRYAVIGSCCQRDLQSWVLTIPPHFRHAVPPLRYLRQTPECGNLVNR